MYDTIVSFLVYINDCLKKGTCVSCLIKLRVIMQIYLVGGAVRDELLHRPIKERDWVVVGTTPEHMLRLGFKPVGKDFPVFLHPNTHEEYALARTERKVGKGYKGFTFHTDPKVTLKDDLMRRDLTINAMAKDDQGHLIDPYGGQKDLSAKLLRHVSDAFQEDPVRILRTARFASKLPNFTLHPYTVQLMRAMVKSGEVNALVKERVWQEWVRALAEKKPQRFFEVLRQVHALDILFPAIQRCPQMLTRLTQASRVTDSTRLRFAALLSPLASKEIVNLCRCYRVPNCYADLAELSSREYQHYLDFNIHRAKDILCFLTAMDALRRADRFKDALDLYRILDERSNVDKTHSLLFQAVLTIKSVNTDALVSQGLRGLDFAQALERKRIAAIELLLKA
jgi:tRNA nucleotidyltransferase (CCA-adding enzyme)